MNSDNLSVVGHIHSLESFGTVDGPGTRYVVFLQGCPMRCQYCHNPDTWPMHGGKDMTVNDILTEYEKGKEFYKTGGITCTGGEPMMQIDFVTALFTECQKRGIHTCLDTSGIAFNPANETYVAKCRALAKVTSLVMLDIKHIDPEEHKKLTSQPNDGILAFAHFLEEEMVPLWIRHVVVPGITYDEHWLYETGRFIGLLRNLKSLDVLPYHNMAIPKYENLGIPYPLKDTPPLSKEDAVKARDIILKGLHDVRREHGLEK